MNPARRRAERSDDQRRMGDGEWVILPMPPGFAPPSFGVMDLAVIAGVASTGLFAMSYLPMLVKAVRTKDLSSYSLGNLVYSVYVFSLPVGPIWLLHSFYLVASAAMLGWFLRYRATWNAPRPPHEAQDGERDRELERATS